MYIVVCDVILLGTSNWSGDYFVMTGGVAVIINQTVPQQFLGRRPQQHHSRTDSTVRQQLEDIFNRDWNSQYAHSLSSSGAS